MTKGKCKQSMCEVEPNNTSTTVRYFESDMNVFSFIFFVFWISHGTNALKIKVREE